MESYQPYANPKWDSRAVPISQSTVPQSPLIPASALNSGKPSCGDLDSSSNHDSASWGEALSGGYRGGVGRWQAEKESPVKAACLSCRAKKAKCDGVQPVCGQCEKKGLECVFVKSRRGGARRKREVPPPSALQEFLLKLDGLLSVHDPTLTAEESDRMEETTNIVQTFASREDVLDAYYNEVHPFLPVMPPRSFSHEVMAILPLQSPFLLAAQTILVLVPHPNDPNPGSAKSKRLRFAASARLGQQTMDLVERILTRQSTLECVQALAMLSMWEWGNAGNLEKNRARAGQAVQVAMELGLHEMDQELSGIAVEGVDWERDMARRTWWVIYAAQITAAVVSGNDPVIGPDDTRIQVNFPVCSLEDRAWPNWINTLRHCCRSFALVNSVYYSQQSQPASTSWGSPGAGGLGLSLNEQRSKIVQVDREVMEFMKLAEASSVIELVPGGEEEVVRNQQLSARLGLAVTHIHIHRQQAFPEVSLFSKKICGLPQAPDRSQLVMPGLDDVAVPRALSEDLLYAETSADQRMKWIAEPNASHLGATQIGLDVGFQSSASGPHDLDETSRQPGEYLKALPPPWFEQDGGAAALWRPTEVEPHHFPALTAAIVPMSPSDPGRRASDGQSRQDSVVSMSPGHYGSAAGPRSSVPHKAWGVDANDKALTVPDLDIPRPQIFPPGLSLARCATAAHTIVRLEVLHRSAVIALWKGPPKWLPFCACGLVTGAYAFLLLALAVQAENAFGTHDESRQHEVDALLTNVKIILAGLEAYGVMWGGIDIMANEVRAALEAAMRLPSEVRAQLEGASGSPLQPSADISSSH